MSDIQDPCGWPVLDCAFAPHVQHLRARIEALEAELRTLTQSGIAEVAVRNPNVMEYMTHWEGRAEKAEAERDTAIAAAYEAAARAADPAQMTCLDAYDEGRLDAADDIRALTPADAIAARDADRARVRREALPVAAALAAAISLLERGGKKAAPSDKMFEQMLNDYRKALDDFRAMIKEEGNG